MRSPFIFDWVTEYAERDPSAPAVDGLHARLTYGRLAQSMLELAADLASKGVASGDRVMLVLPTTPASAVASLAIQWLGACAVDVDRGIGPASLEKVVEQLRPRYAIAARRDARLWTEVLRGRQLDAAWLLDDGGGRRGGEREAFPAREVTRLQLDGTVPGSPRARDARRGPLDENAAAAVLLTSGSTGQPRAVIHTFRNIAANTRSIVEYLGLTASDRAMLILPFSYTYGRSVLQTHLHAGGSVFVDPRFMYPRTVLEAIESERCTGFAGVPLTFEILRRSVDVADVPMSRLRYVTQAGGPMRPETTRWARAAFAPARLFVMYGQTEATARLTYVPPERGEEKLGSIGISIPGVELSIVDETGSVVPPGTVGHLVARGENVTPGYLDAPEETARILRGGWLWTGDLARQDADGYYWVAGRSDDLLKIAGYRVSVTEIEEILHEHPAVADAAVVGIDDPLQGSVPVAFVVPRQAADDLEAHLRRLCLERGGPHKVPAEILLVDAVPRTPSGKPRKAELVARARAAPRKGTPT
jgi:long-chain acyl-CoA synthetase